MLDDPQSLDTEERECLQLVPALVDAVMADVDESFLEEETFESELGLRVTVHELRRRPTIRMGSPQPTTLTESERDELKLSLDTCVTSKSYHIISLSLAKCYHE